MIPRYTRSEMAKIWTEQRKFETWLEIELLVCEAFSKLGEIPAEAVRVIKEKACFDVNRVNEIEKVTKHDVIAFLTNVGESIGPFSKYLHYGLTSSDILDTSLALLLKEASELILQDLHRLLEVLKEKAFQYKETLMIGRTHGVHAEPITFGLKMALWHDETKRNLARMDKSQRSCKRWQDLRCGGNVRPRPSLRRRVRLFTIGTQASFHLNADCPEGSPCRILHHVGHHRLFDRKIFRGTKAPSANRSFGSGGILLQRPERLLCHAP
jgi:hypothetical protein